jgi:hypothetical protein
MCCFHSYCLKCYVTFISPNKNDGKDNLIYFKLGENNSPHKHTLTILIRYKGNLERGNYNSLKFPCTSPSCTHFCLIKEPFCQFTIIILPQSPYAYNHLNLLTLCSVACSKKLINAQQIVMFTLPQVHFIKFPAKMVSRRV